MKRSIEDSVVIEEAAKKCNHLFAKVLDAATQEQKLKEIKNARDVMQSEIETLNRIIANMERELANM